MSDSSAYLLAHSLYQERLENNAYAMQQLFSLDAVFEITGTGNNPTVVRVGNDPAKLQAFIEHIAASWRWIKQDIHDILGDGNRIAARYTLLAEFIPLERRVEMQVADFFRFQDGYISHLTQYVDTALVDRLNAELIEKSEKNL